MEPEGRKLCSVDDIPSQEPPPLRIKEAEKCQESDPIQEGSNTNDTEESGSESADTLGYSKEILNDEWGPEGTLEKIMKSIYDGVKPVTIKSLTMGGPLTPKYRAIITAKCFHSVLQLKQHGLVTLKKDPKTLEIVEICIVEIDKIKATM